MSELEAAAEAVLTACRKANLTVATAESCTGGLISSSLVGIPGSSAVMDRGFVTYSNQAKMDMLGVPESLLMSHGAVSEEVALSMAEGALARSNATLAVSVTGIAGPDGGSAAKPVGLVHMAVARAGFATRHERHLFEGDRLAVREAAALAALALMERMAQLP